MSKYAQVVPGSSKQSLQHMISKSHWRNDLILNQIQKDVTKLIGNEINGSIHIDESSFPKQGENSVGVARQYCGRLGKVDNCQVGVFLGYVNGRNRTLIDERLYLPKEWAEDHFRRREAGVPDEVIFKTLTPHVVGNKPNPSLLSKSLTFFGTSEIRVRSPILT